MSAHVRLPEDTAPAALGLDVPLPMSVFTSTERWHPERIRALAVYCSDGRWGDAFDEFCHRHLLIPRYDRWAVPGGPAWFLDEAARALVRKQVDFLVDVHKLERIILIAHFGCAYYGHHLHKAPHECLAAQTADVRRAVPLLQAWYPTIRVESFLAMRSMDCLSFHELKV